jgi:hypothetical protein
MSVEDNLQAYLVTISAITTLTDHVLPVGNVHCVVPVQASQDLPFPRIVYEKTGDAPWYSDAGDSGLKEATFDIECQALTIHEAEAVRDATYTALSGYKGAMGTSTVAVCFIDNESDTAYPAVHGGEEGVKSKTLEVRLQYR